ncbi:MAG: hypothetical protein J6V11_04205 [Alphaproteobacteria bacterium]|nr:hypothetical protein [Alphaproteobacteria bacterium]
MKIICPKCRQHLDVESQGIYKCPCGQEFLLSADGTVEFASSPDDEFLLKKPQKEIIHCPSCFNEIVYNETYLGCTLQCSCGYKWMLPTTREALKRLESKLCQRHSQSPYTHTYTDHVKNVTYPQRKEKKQRIKSNNRGQSKTNCGNQYGRHIINFFSNLDFDNVSALLTVLVNAILGIILLCIVSFWGYRSCNSSFQEIKVREKKLKVEREKYGSCTDAQRFIEEAICRILKAPSTAKITFTRKPKHDGITYYDFEGYWDAQNSFGVYLRTYFKISLKYENGVYVPETVKTFQ